MTPEHAELLSSVGVDPAWSRTVDDVHLLDRPGTDPQAPTVVCVHGNPTWSVLWAPLLAGLDARYRVIAIDQVGMGWSGGAERTYRQRIDDLNDILRAAGVDGPVVLVGHDWGGAVVCGWAVDHPERVAAMVLCNTGLAVPEGRRAPWLIRLAATGPILDLVTRRTSLFVRATPRLPGAGINPEMRAALAAPYRHRRHRRAIAGFVADIPFDDSHRSAADLADVAERIGMIDAAVLLVWGGRDPVFDDSFADDLSTRIPHAELHRDPDAGHLSPIEVDLAPIVGRFLDHSTRERVETGPDPVSALAPLAGRASDTALAFHDGARNESVSFAELWDRIHDLAAGLVARGVRRGDRVAILVPPGIDLVAVVYACWRIGAVTVIADRGLGRRGLGAAVRSARVDAVVGIRQGIIAARVLRWAPGANLIAVGSLAGSAADLGDEPDLDDPAAVLFTSGATGPAKGVRYTHRQLGAQRDALRALYGIGPDDRLVAAFAPFSLFGPALAIATALPDVDVTAPATLTADALEAACAEIGATMVFASPAALSNVVATASGPLPALAQVRTVMSAGAPISVPLLESVACLAPDARLHTPYGMTEVLPVADADVAMLRTAEGRGVCVGAPVPGCEVRIDDGEVLIAAPWCSSGYDRLADTERRARSVESDGRLWHRSGDLGHLDGAGRLWIEGRVVHAIHTAVGIVTPVPIELAAESAGSVGRAAAVGIGPVGVQQLVVIVEASRRRSLCLASVDLATEVRTTIAEHVPDAPSIAAVLEMGPFPVDVRHNSKIDRTLLAAQAAALLSGRG